MSLRPALVPVAPMAPALTGGRVRAPRFAIGPAERAPGWNALRQLVLGRILGGLLAAAGACAGFLALPVLAAPLGGSDVAGDALVKPELMVTFLTIVGVLAGVLGERVQRTAGDLERTERELDRVKVD